MTDRKMTTFRKIKLHAYRTGTLLLLLGCLLFINCQKTTSVDYDETRINTIFYKLKQAFNDKDINNFMNYFHTDYLHKGQTRWMMREVWLDRMAEYLLIDFQNISISVQNSNAVVTFTMKLQKENQTVFSDEPAAHGDISYFIYDNYDWSVYGDQNPD